MTEAMERWCGMSMAERREWFVTTLEAAFSEDDAVTGARVEVGPVERPYDLTAVLETDAGDLRAPLWSHARASIYCDGSVHPDARGRLAPEGAVEEAAAALRQWLAVPYELGQRGLTVTIDRGEGLARTWTVEKSLFRGAATITREDRMESPPEEADLRDLLEAFYAGPSLRLVGKEGPLHLPAGADGTAAPLVSLCPRCERWAEGDRAACPHCGGPVEVTVRLRPARR
jgi:hypothetical protein